MGDAESVILDELQALSPLDLTVRPAWDDVLSRARTTRERLPRRRRRLFFIGGPLIAVLAVVIATPAFGVRSFIADVIGGKTTVPFKGTKPAPTIVKRQFADLGLGAPPGMAPGAIVSQTRTVTHVRFNGRRRALWVAPTRTGGLCWELERSMGGCQPSIAYLRAHQPKSRTRGDLHPELLGVSWMSGSATNGFTGSLVGIVRLPNAARVTASFSDGRSVDLPFVFVSAPIDAGFVTWTVPKDEQTKAAHLVAIAARDTTGKLLARFAIPTFPQRRVIPQPRTRPRPRLARPQGFEIPAPTPPLQHGNGDGVTVTVGANGVAVFDMDGLSPARRAASRSFSPGCFKLEHDQLGLWVRGLSTEARSFGSRVKTRLFGVPRPLDGCEIGGSYGHHWPDRFGSHAVVEIPLTAAGRRYFTDRAAARDLAAFVRQGVIQKLRHEDANAIRTGLARYAPRVVAIASTAAPAPAGRIGYVVTPTGVTFVEVSPAGARFKVVVEHGRITNQNLKPYAFVF